jgi:hypothetical protein
VFAKLSSVTDDEIRSILAAARPSQLGEITAEWWGDRNRRDYAVILADRVRLPAGGATYLEDWLDRHDGAIVERSAPTSRGRQTRWSGSNAGPRTFYVVPRSALQAGSRPNAD